MDSYDYLLVGGGMAADAAARGIREVDSGGSIGLFSAETHAPYNRPPLSKGLWQDQTPDEIMRDTGDLGVHMHLGTRIETVDAAAQTVTDDQGRTWHYGKLLLATGGSPRRLTGPDEGVIYYRTLADYHRLRELTSEPRRVLVLGGGYIGAELAAALRLNGHEVQIAFPEQTLLGRLLPDDLGEYLNSYYGEKGVEVLPGRLVEAVHQTGAHSRVTFSDASEAEADVVVAGLGIIPELELARQAGLTLDNGIEVDQDMRSSDPHIFAAGDVASVWSPALKRRRRVEHEQNANETGLHAGMAMAGASAPYRKLQLFYSDLFDLGFEGVGLADRNLETVARWSEPFRKGTIHYLEDGRLVGALMWNDWGKADRMRELITSGAPFKRD